MNVYMTEEEQLQRIREWFKQYGLTIFISIIVAITASIGWRLWQSQHETMLMRASVTYESMLISISNHDSANAMKQAQFIVQQYPHSPYAALAAFMQAKIEIEQNNYANAEKTLFWAVDNAPNKPIKNIAILRLARLLIADGKANQAIDLTMRIRDKSFYPLVMAIRGDGFTALQEIGEARDAYEKALAAFTENPSLVNNPIYQLIKMKLNSLPAAG